MLYQSIVCRPDAEPLIRALFITFLVARHGQCAKIPALKLLLQNKFSSTPNTHKIICIWKIYLSLYNLKQLCQILQNTQWNKCSRLDVKVPVAVKPPVVCDYLWHWWHKDWNQITDASILPVCWATNESQSPWMLSGIWEVPGYACLHFFFLISQNGFPSFPSAPVLWQLDASLPVSHMGSLSSVSWRVLCLNDEMKCSPVGNNFKLQS